MLDKTRKQKQKTVLIGLSGGVDSAVAALLLKKQGYKVVAAFMKNFSGNRNDITGECNWVEDKKDAQRIASILDIPLIILDFEKHYRKHIISEMFKAYKLGLTPNPDSLCNKIIKFPFLWEEAKKRKIDYIATGHYIKKVKNKKGFSLNMPKDKHKDQSYFLYDLTQKDLEHTLFPISNLTKSQVRQIAKQHKFPNYDKSSSKGVCFVGKLNFKSFLEQKIKQKQGKVLSPEGQLVGSHKGIYYYTIGERVGEGKNISILDNYRNKIKSKIYIASKNLRNNTLTVAPENHPTLYKSQFRIIKSNWINRKPKNKEKVKVRIRHLGPLIPATIFNNVIKLHNPVFGLAEGQSAVIYHDNEILGGGEIRYA